MNTSTFSLVLTALITLSALLYSSTSIAHSDRRSGFSVNTYVIASSSGLARNYFNYSYDTRRAKKLARYHRVSHRPHRHNHHYSDCPYAGHDHHH